MNALASNAISASVADVVLVSMPFGLLQSPSLALGILQARLEAAGIVTISRHFTLDYAARIGVETYSRIAAGFPQTTDLLGEWIFSHAVAPKDLVQRERYLARVFGAFGLPPTGPGRLGSAVVANEQRIRMLELILELAERAGNFANYAAEEICKYSPRIVGFTSVFEQNMASLAVAARLRRLDPAVKILFGGANCEGPMGRQLAQAFPFLDLVVSGEADLAIVPLVRGLLAGVHPRDNTELRSLAELAADAFLATRMVHDLDDHPAAAFDDYFCDLSRRPSIADQIEVQIPMETSRGCWWGAKHHCTFCGLNGSTMAFRSKSPEQVIGAIAASAARYPGAKICFVDNIMDYRYFDTLLPALADAGLDLDLFYEIKSNISKPQVAILKNAGVGHIQPGIESLSDQVLRIMRKGVRAIQNLQLLKWCREFGVEVDWNLIWGFPGEDPDEYQRMAALVPLICHLQPPARGTRIRLDRFSPNFTAASELGFANVRPYESYFDVYDGLPREAVSDLAYFFQANDEQAIVIEEYTRDLSTALTQWQAAHSASGFFYIEFEGRVILIDSRAMRVPSGTSVLDDLQSRVFLSCDTAHPLSAICRELPDVSADRIEAVLAALCRDGTMWSDGDRYVSLAVSFATFLQSRANARLEEAIDDILSAEKMPTRSPAAMAESIT